MSEKQNVTHPCILTQRRVLLQPTRMRGLRLNFFHDGLTTQIWEKLLNEYVSPLSATA